METVEEMDTMDAMETAEEAGEIIENPQSPISTKIRVEDDSFEKTESYKKLNETLVEELNLLRPDNPYREFDERRYEIRNKIKEKFKDAPKTPLDIAEEEKPPIEKQLEDTDKALAELLAFGDEIITNIKVANEKRELLRREYEEVQRANLAGEIHKESTEAMAQYDDIVARWSELGELKEPMVMFNKLEQQKERIGELMRSKDEMISACQIQIDRINERFQEDQQKQQADICALVERIDGQVELLKNAYKYHLDLLQDTIDSERQTIALKEQTKWNEFYETMQQSEQFKIDIAKEKKAFYTQEIKRITEQQEEITRATRIRLEKDAEMLEYELRSTKNQVLMNSEKLDYNYQVLQKRNEENVIINNQQKRRVAKLSEAISDIKRRIQTAQSKAEQTITKLTNDIQKLHDSITDLEKKSVNFRLSNRKKFFNIWSINYDEVKTLIEKVFDIDRILYEQQLGLSWERPDVDLEEFPLVAAEKGLFRLNNKNNKKNNETYNNLMNSTGAFSGLRGDKVKCSYDRTQQGKRKSMGMTQKAEEARKRYEQRIEMRLLRNILRRISDRARFLVEDRLLEFLEPYSEDQKTLVRVDNIFAALRITDMQAVNKLVDFFRPYAWCPNCMKGIPREQIKKLYKDCGKVEKPEEDPEEENEVETEDCSSELADETPVDPSIQEIGKVGPSIPCDNHYLIVEPFMVLTALNEFANHQNQKGIDIQVKRTSVHPNLDENEHEHENKTVAKICSVEINNEDITQYWQKFLNFMPKQKQKLWHSLEHGLQHYLDVLKQREQLDKECAFLRRQNAELKHLLQKFDI